MAATTAAMMQAVNRYPRMAGTLVSPKARRGMHATADMRHPGGYWAIQQPIRQSRLTPDRTRQALQIQSIAFFIGLPQSTCARCSIASLGLARMGMVTLPSGRGS